MSQLQQNLLQTSFKFQLTSFLSRIHLSADPDKNLNSDLIIGKLCQHLYQSDLYLIQRKE